jgi:hypothetical protein
LWGSSGLPTYDTGGRVEFGLFPQNRFWVRGRHGDVSRWTQSYLLGKIKRMKSATRVTSKGQVVIPSACASSSTGVGHPAWRSCAPRNPARP